MRLENIVSAINGLGVNAEVREIIKDAKPVMSITLGEGTIRPTLYPKDFEFDKDGNERTDEEIARCMVETYNSAPHTIPGGFDTNDFVDYKKAKNKLKLCVRRLTDDDSILKKKYLDMEMYVRYVVNDEASIIIKPEHLENWKVQPDTVFRKATDNTKGTFTIRSMEAVICEMMGMSIEELNEMMGAPRDDHSVAEQYVITNSEKLFGASAIKAGIGQIKEFCRDFNLDSVYILPSSVHELLLVTSDIPVSHLQSMVKEVNETQVEEKDRLSDSVYKYTLSTNRVTLLAA